ncbi:hypothetical protein H0H93_007756 [Arthromyces matolae]|nr:hypothetical protein H0H93_007756 [Arthromyces matolae]
MANSSLGTSVQPISPFAKSSPVLEIIHSGIDVEEESRLYDDIVQDFDNRSIASAPGSLDFQGPPSVFSKEIWLENKSGTKETFAFAQDVKISGWTNGTMIHVHKRYSDFDELESVLRRTLPQNQRHYVPNLPPKSPLSRYRPAFLDKRRRHLQSWLSAVLLHPDVGGSKAVRIWVMT